MHHLFRILGTVWVRVIYPEPLSFICATFFGMILRCLHIACFFLTLQALVITAFPERGGLLSGAERLLVRHIPIFEQMNLAIFSATLVIAAYLFQLAIQFIYQKVIGNLIGKTKSQFIRSQAEPKVAEMRRIATALVENSVKTSEILGFLLTLGCILAFFNFLILVALVVGGLLALSLFVWVGRWKLRHKKWVALEKQALVNGEGVEAFIAADEQARFNKHLSHGKEGAIIGLLTAFIIIVFVMANIHVDTTNTQHVFILMFSLRYAIIYVRELGRGVSGLLDLRTEKLVKEI